MMLGAIRAAGASCTAFRVRSTLHLSKNQEIHRFLDIFDQLATRLRSCKTCSHWSFGRGSGGPDDEERQGIRDVRIFHW